MSFIYINPYSFAGIVTDGLVLHLDAGNSTSYPGSGTTWADLSGNGNTGTLTNGPTYSSADGGSIVFDGSNDFVDCGGNALLNFTNNFTLSAWFYRATTQPSVDAAIVGKIQLPYTGYMLWYNSSTVDLYFNGSPRVNSSTTISANIWYNVAGTYNGATASIYINGTLDVATSVATSADATGVNFMVGKYNDPPERNFAGNISNVQAYNRALTAAEVTQNFNALRGRYGL
jgi:hypothetical protein